MYTGYPSRQYPFPTKRYCRMLDIVDDADLIAKYRECHSEAKAWPEILEGIKSVGILEMEMYIHDNHVFMIVETPMDFEWDSAMERLSKLPRQAEWEAYVSAFQGCKADAAATEKWQMMEQMFHLYQ